ncbi:MAG: DUF2309 domain-containing protein [Deltaproteobacteria bacterium]
MIGANEEVPTVARSRELAWPEIVAAVDEACSCIAPTWPLDRFIAVNPFWSWIGTPIEAASARIEALTGSRLLMPRAWYRAQWREGRLRPEHLREAIEQTGASVTEATMRALLESDEPGTARRARVMDVVDAHRDLTSAMSWRDFVVDATSGFCAEFFDDGQARMSPDRDGGLYASWRRRTSCDRAPSLLMGLEGYGALARALPGSSEAMIATALGDLEVPTDERASYLASLLLDLNGWAAWCAYRRWTARLEGAGDDAIVELLAVRLAWEWMLFRAGRARLRSRWQLAMASWPTIDTTAERAQAQTWLLQRAVEIAWQSEVCARLPEAVVGPRVERPSAQVVFCIDVRSEVLRRALEATDATIETLGFAGFFGLPIEYESVGAQTARPQLPGLLAPRFKVRDASDQTDLATTRRRRIDEARSWKRFRTGPVSGFSFVESIGPFFAGTLFDDLFGRAPDPSRDDAGYGLRAGERAGLEPRLVARSDGAPLSVDERGRLAEQILRGLSLTRGFAPIVMLVGHGSETRNNPHSAGLDCGACCGQTGEVNARVATALLNDPDVRRALRDRGIDVPASTMFVAGLHNTTVDAIVAFDHAVPATHREDVERLRASLAEAGRRARRERAGRLELDGLDGLDDRALERAMVALSRDWSQVRPEWGLADNAAFVIAPRARTRALDLLGRAFLHEYRFDEDADGAVLEAILNGPMVVTHWINMQYYASTVDNGRYGSGNKVLHNVVGGHIGVLEGNGGDLRIGLPMQSLHDGRRWVHTPLRLSVFVEAPSDSIDALLDKHPTLRSLVDHAWIHLFRIDPTSGVVSARRRSGWRAVAGSGSQGPVGDA